MYSIVMLSEKSTAVKHRKNYEELDAEGKQRRFKSTYKYIKKRYETDEDFKHNLLQRAKNDYNNRVKDNAELMERKKLSTYLRMINLKHKANEPIKITKTYIQHKVFFDEEQGVYRSLKLNDNSNQTIGN